MNIVPINEGTVDIITELNGGVRPEFENEEEPIFFIWNGPDEVAEIVSFDEMSNRFDGLNTALVQMLYMEE